MQIHVIRKRIESIQIYKILSQSIKLALFMWQYFDHRA